MRLKSYVFGSLAEFEHERIIERTREGLTAARSSSRISGRPGAFSKDQRDEVRRMRELGRSIREIARLFDVSASTV